MKVKRVYLPYENSDGFRVLVDRLWPRGLSKQSAHIDLWFKEIAPSNELRKWFHENIDERWPEFEKRYLEELKSNQAVVQEFRSELKGHSVITLLYGAKDETRNQAVVLKSFLGSE